MEFRIEIKVNKFVSVELKAYFHDNYSRNLQKDALIPLQMANKRPADLIKTGMKTLLEFPNKCTLSGVIKKMSTENGFLNRRISKAE